MPLSDDRGQNRSADDEATGSSARRRLALPIPIIRGAKQTTILPQFLASSWLTDCNPSYATARPASKDPTTSPWRKELSTQPILSRGQSLGTLLVPSVNASKAATSLQPTGRHPCQGWNNSGTAEEPNQHIVKEEQRRWLSSKSSRNTPQRSQRVVTSGHGVTSDMLRRPLHLGRKSKSENGASADRAKVKDAPQVTKTATRVLSPNGGEGEVQPLRSVQSRHTPRRPIANTPPACVDADFVDAADLQATLPPGGTSIGYLDRLDRVSREVIMAPSSIHLDPSLVQCGSPSSLHRHLSHQSDRLLPPLRTSSQPTHWQACEVSVQSRPEPCHARLLHHHLEELPISDGRPAYEVTGMCHDTQSLDSDGYGSCPTSPRSCISSADNEHETPMTSPSRSPTKRRPNLTHFAPFVHSIPQLDGEAGDATDEEGEAQHVHAALVIGEPGVVATAQGLPDGSISDNDVFHSAYSVQPLDDQFTPLVTPSLAKGALASPFSRNSIFNRTQSRHPSTLLQQCERNATPRQRRLMTGGAQSPDRFIPSRSGIPTKQSLLMTKRNSKPRGFSLHTAEPDPFGPLSARSLRMVDQYATLRSPALPMHPVGVATHAEQPQGATTRAASVGTIWTVGGTMVTEGIASVTNGRGGRVTSGTNAPHYAADFLHKNTPSEDEVTHSRRLAIAMEIERAARMLVHSPPSSNGSSPESVTLSSSSSRTWKDGTWQQRDCLTPTKSKPKKFKDVPVIPFRVLDAPALRDDYYCSLLSYSPTIQCLAVGLGPHVYLWSEKRGSTNNPDSLSAPAGSSHVTSVSFSSVEGGSAILALGRADGRITLWSPLDRDPRFDSDQPSPISCLAFRPTTVRRPSLRDGNVMVATEELLVGDEVGFVYFYSVEWPKQDQRDLFDWHGSMSLLARVECHSQQVCGLAWSCDGDYFATGGNDNQLFVFESKNVLRGPSSGAIASSAVRVRAGSSHSSNATVTRQGEVLAVTPGAERHVFPLNAAVKAIAFAPWQSTLLAAGGGSNDRCVHFFHTLSGSPLATIDCHAQVTSLVWSEKRKEIACTFGFAQPEHPYRVAVFAWPSCNMVVRIPWWSEERALFAVAYPRGPSSGQQGQGASGTAAQRTDAEGRPWYGKRTREEGCLVVATSDASIKFHEIWAEKSSAGGKNVSSGVFGGSQILEEEYTGDLERWGNAIR